MTAPDAQARLDRCVLRAQQGDRQAFAELVAAHQSDVRRQLRQLTRGDHALADELAQEAFFQAWRHLPAFRRDAAFGTWLYRIAYRGFLMHRRSAPPDAVAPALADSGESPEEAMAPESEPGLRLDLQRALQRLPEAERVALLHCLHLDLSHSEAAAVLGVPLGTVKTHVLRGRARLRELLSAWNPKDPR